MAKLPTAIALNRERQERKERQERFEKAYSLKSLSAAIEEPESYLLRPDFLDLPSFRKYPKSLGSPSPKPERKVELGRASELRRDHRRAEGGDMDLGDNVEVKEETKEE